jgi:hypothetical protein
VPSLHTGASSLKGIFVLSDYGGSSPDRPLPIW